MKKKWEKETEQLLIAEVKRGNESAFAEIFTRYYKDLVLFGGNFINDKSKVEDVVQSVFLKLWDSRSELQIDTSLKSYLLKAVQNSCLNIIKRSRIVQTNSMEDVIHDQLLHHDTENYILFSELENHINSAIEKLPENYRNVFTLGKIKGMKYSEISDQLLISERTVELWMSKALSLMRIYLKDFLILLFFLLVNKS